MYFRLIGSKYYYSDKDDYEGEIREKCYRCRWLWLRLCDRD